MEVNQTHFKKELLPILKHIANSSFVSFDLEMSGIHRHSRFGLKAGGHDNGKPSLQQLYEETRTAAETFQVLQVGITFIEEDREKEYYVARPYNFNLSPLFYLDNRFKDRFPERKIVFSSSAADFLQGQGFNIGKVFSDGVYYLSHAEEEEARERFRQRNERETGKPDIVIPPNDTKALDFYRSARKTISAWVNATKQEHPFVNIGDPNGRELNGFQRLLVHQLVKSEFPGYRSFARSKQSFIQIEKIDPKKESQDNAKKLDEFNDALAKQIGLRWIFEALTGGDLSDIPVTWFCDENTKPELNQKAIAKEFEDVKIALKKKVHVLVGHNLFTDLVCVYKTFVGPLPALVEDFQERIRGLFPIILDTKYLATEGHDSMSTVMRKSLSELVEPFKKIHTPLIVLHEKHTSYGTTFGKNHEAGFDSWMTAELFVKLASKLYADRVRTGDFPYDDAYSTASDCGSRPSFSDDESSGDGGTKLDSHPFTEDDLLDIAVHTSNGIHSMGLSDNFPSAWHADQIQNMSGQVRKSTTHDRNPYAVLDDSPEETGSGVEDSVMEEDPNPAQWIPQMTNIFWGRYTNKLRVNASQGGVCDLNEEY